MLGLGLSLTLLGGNTNTPPFTLEPNVSLALGFFIERYFEQSAVVAIAEGDDTTLYLDFDLARYVAEE